MMRRYNIAFLSVLIAIVLSRTFILLAQEYIDEEEEFFALNKYSYTYKYFNVQRFSPGRSFAEVKVKDLAERFVEGFNALSQERPEEAILHFRQASRILPEYFHTDFILAFLFEKKADTRSAARFYKSYLEKLQKFEEGRYRFTQPLITETVDFSITDYKAAKELVRRRVAGYGINIDEVSTADYALFIVIIFIFSIGGILYYLSKKDSVKRIFYKAMARRNRSGDLWICFHCGKENASINLVCYNCNLGRKE